MWYQNLKKKTLISRQTLYQLWYTCPITLPVSKPEAQKSWLFISHFRIYVSTSSSSAKCLPPRWQFHDPVVNYFMWQTLPTINRKHFFMNILCIESFCPQIHTREHYSSVVYPQVRSPFWLLKPASEHVHAHLLPTL
jgi:hypothetical protein